MAKALETVGVLVLVGGIAWSGIRYVAEVRSATAQSPGTHFRRSIGRSMLPGLGLLIVTRTFLGVEIEMKIDGHWPWQRTKLEEAERASAEAG